MTVPVTSTENGTLFCKLHCKKIRTEIKFASLNQIFSSVKHASILGGNDAKAQGDGFSYWAAEPLEVFQFRSNEKSPFVKLSKSLNKYKLKSTQKTQLPDGCFAGGWVGYFSYELGKYIEKIADRTSDDIDIPLIRLCFYDKVICYDHKQKNFWLITLQLPNEKTSPEEKITYLEKLLTEANSISVPLAPAGDIEKIDFSNINCNIAKHDYLNAIDKIKRHIYDGDVYQVNFSQRFCCDYKASAVKLFHWQNHYNPSSYSGYIDAGSFQIVSASPEMFITLNDRIIATKPIKGTRPKVNDRTIDKINFEELLCCPKEQAELNMIIDLERNDIAKICTPGTRKVIQNRTIETYPTVFHAVATVQGRLKDKEDFCDIIKSMFPGGSITGAPKVSAMQIIENTEPTARAVYTGSIGYIGIDGNACLNIAIRTIIIKDEKAYAQSGGGIVADSKPEDEWNETLTKARALVAGIIAVNKNNARNSK